MNLNRLEFQPQSWSLIQLFIQWMGFLIICISLAQVETAKAAAPNIQGSVEIDVQVGNVVNTALAADSVAQVSIGSISEGDMGPVKIKIVHGDVINTAEGIGSCAQVMIGSIGVPSCVAGPP